MQRREDEGVRELTAVVALSPQSQGDKGVPGGLNLAANQSKQTQTAHAGVIPIKKALPMEKRHFHRLPFDASLRLISANHQWQSKLVDISLKGALVERPDGWEGTSGERFVLEIMLSVGTVIKMRVVVVHFNKHFIGMRCEEIDIDSISHLKRLVAFNLNDEELLERDLSALGTERG